MLHRTQNVQFLIHPRYIIQLEKMKNILGSFHCDVGIPSAEFSIGLAKHM